MKAFLVRACWPILRLFETGEEAADYRPSHRLVLIIVGALFVALSTGSAISAYVLQEVGALIPFVVFFGVGCVALVVGLLGSNAAVARIWSRK